MRQTERNLFNFKDNDFEDQIKKYREQKGKNIDNPFQEPPKFSNIRDQNIQIANEFHENENQYERNSKSYICSFSCCLTSFLSLIFLALIVFLLVHSSHAYEHKIAV